MTTYTLPNTSVFCPSSFQIGLLPNIISSETAPFSGRYKTIEVPGARWAVTIGFPPGDNDTRAAQAAFFSLLRGKANRLSLWNIPNPVPRGTLQSNTTLSSSASQHAAVVNIAASTGLTLLAGDMIGIALAAGGTHLVMVTQDVTSVGGVMTSVPIAAPLRGAANSGAVVTVIRPTATFILDDEIVSLPWTPGISPGFVISLTEDPA